MGTFYIRFVVTSLSLPTYIGMYLRVTFDATVVVSGRFFCSRNYVRFFLMQGTYLKVTIKFASDIAPKYKAASSVK